MVRTARCARAARAIEEPIRPKPIRARRSKSGPSIIALSFAMRTSTYPPPCPSPTRGEGTQAALKSCSPLPPIFRRSLSVERGAAPGFASGTSLPLALPAPSPLVGEGWGGGSRIAASRLPQKFGERLHRKPVRLLAAPAHAQGVGQL